MNSDIYYIYCEKTCMGASLFYILISSSASVTSVMCIFRINRKVCVCSQITNVTAHTFRRWGRGVALPSAPQWVNLAVIWHQNEVVLLLFCFQIHLCISELVKWIIYFASLFGFDLHCFLFSAPCGPAASFLCVYTWVCGESGGGLWSALFECGF